MINGILRYTHDNTMKTIGQLLKDARESKYISLNRLEDVTKIKSSFIQSIENEKWDQLPTFPTVLGFVKSLGGALDMDEKLVVAILKRDYPPKKLKINPSPDIASKFVWNPKISFFIGVFVVFLFIVGYLVFQYVRFISPPNLNVDSPKSEQIVAGNSVLVFGSTDIDSKVTVNNQPVVVDEDGKFSIALGVSTETKEVNIRAVSRSGKTTEVTRKITVQQ